MELGSAHPQLVSSQRSIPSTNKSQISIIWPQPKVKCDKSEDKNIKIVNVVVVIEILLKLSMLYCIVLFLL